MIARLQALTALEFDIDAVKAGTRPNISGAIVDSANGWPIDHAFPHYRRILSPDAIHHGYLSNTANSREKHINERVHWSVIAKHHEQKTPLYDPPNLFQHIPANRSPGLQIRSNSCLNVTPNVI